MTNAMKCVGKSVHKVDGMALACGGALFADDIPTNAFLSSAILYSPHAHARIRRINTTAAEALEGVRAVLHFGNVPRIMHTTAGQGAPEPSPHDTALFDSKVRFVGDRVAAVAATSPAVAREALSRIEVEYEILPAVFDLRQADAEEAPVIHDEPDARAVIPVVYEPQRNIAAAVDAHVGDVEEGLAKAAVQLEAEYETPYAQHCPLEPHVCLSYFDSRGRIVIRTSTQVPFHVRRIVARLCGLALHQIRVVKPRIGGGFGAKQEVLLEPICAMLTLRTGYPVKIELSRAEEFVSSRTRHPAVVRLRLGLSREGAIEAIDMRVRTNTGAYGSHALTVASNCGSKVLPLYPCAHVSFRAESVYTNGPVAGAYRGYGATQSAFAMEALLDEAAERLGLDPLELRLRTHIKEGESSPVFRMLGEGTEGVEQRVGSCGLRACIELGAAAFDWQDRAARRATNAPWRRGFGMAIGMQGSSIPKVDMGAASLKMNEDGSFNLLVGATDLGTGSDTVLAQIAAEVLGVPLSKIIIYSSDTDVTPFDVGAYASSTTYLSGRAVEKVAHEVAAQIRSVAAEMLDLDPGRLALRSELVVSDRGHAVSLASIGERTFYQENQHQIGAMASHVSEKSPPPFAAHFVELEVDGETGFVRVLRYVVAVDCGTAINPKLAEGQCEGAVLNGIGYALTEELSLNGRGRVRNACFRDYKIFGAADAPPIETLLVPSFEESGPFGAKSVSEIGINGPLPAISNAIFDAVGVRLRTAPFTPERVLQALGG